MTQQKKLLRSRPNQYGQPKKLYSIKVTEEAMSLYQQQADRMGISRNELFERNARMSQDAADPEIVIELESASLPSLMGKLWGC